MAPSLDRGIIQTALGAIGYLMCDGSTEASSKTPILCFHGSPRCFDEYLEVLPLLAASGRKVIAMDTPGYGISQNPSRSCSFDEIADAFLQVADALLLGGNQGKYCTIGCLMGCFQGVSLASRYPDRVAACINANLYFFPPKEPSIQGKKMPTEPISDSFELKEDGSHLVGIHDLRKNWLDLEMNFRVVSGEVAYLVNRRARYAKGISIEDVGDFDFAAPATKTTCPVLCIKGEACLAFFDTIGYNGTRQFEAGVSCFRSKATVESLNGEKSTINLINQMPEEFSSICLSFLDDQSV